MPPNTVYVGRPTEWGNPYVIGRTTEYHEKLSRDEAVAAFRKWIVARDGDFKRSGRAFGKAYSHVIRHLLRGKNLACWCPLDQPCHADVLLEIANAEEIL